jgi:hypothetical protein
MQKEFGLAALMVVTLAALGPNCGSAAEPDLVPEIQGDWWTVAGQPDLGTLTGEKQEPVDFGIWQARDGTWQLWSCIRKTKETGTGRLFHGWEGRSLFDSDWTPRGIQMRASPVLGEVEGGLQAPFVKVIDGRWHMFYGSWQAICLAFSEDGRFFQRQLGSDGTVGLFGEPKAHNARDAMVLYHEGRWYCYYTAHPGGVGQVRCRTSPDLSQWSDPHVVAIGGEAGDKLWSHECPHVVKVGDWFYLFTTQRYFENPKTSVFRSRDPLSFCQSNDDQRVGFLPVAAPEILHYRDEWYVAALRPQLDGIRVARLKWVSRPAP